MGIKMKKQKLIAYCLTENLKQMIPEDIVCLDAIHIAFGLIRDAEVYWERNGVKEELCRIRRIHPEIRIVLSVGGWAADGFSQAAFTQQGRERFAASAAALVQEENLDGLDIDWEYPGSDAGGIQALPEDKENFTLLLCELRRKLDELEGEKTLSIAAGGQESYLRRTNMKEAQQYLDYVQLMTYDYHGGFSEHTGHLANLYASCAEPDAPNADQSVRLFVQAGVPMEKLVMGAAFYGRVWNGVPDVMHGLAQVTVVENGDNCRGYDELVHLAGNGEDGFIRYWDEDARAAWLFNGETFISFEDEEALRCKASYAREHGMYGLMYWEYAQDAGHTATRLLYDGLQGAEGCVQPGE